MNNHSKRDINEQLLQGANVNEQLWQGGDINEQL
jgi:hypothetical protein